VLRACALQYGRSLDKNLPYVEFSDNNNYEESLRMASFEILCGHRCQTSLFWNKARELKFLDPT
jgi:cellobiose-specific phosphotransferase system component IIA